MDEGLLFASEDLTIALSLRDRRGYFIMPLAALHTLGPLAARLLGSLLAATRPSTPDVFRPVEAIAADAFLPTPTTRKLLVRLWRDQFLEYRGRERPSERKRCRRPATWRVTKYAFEHRRPWLPWPKWLGEARYSNLPPAAHAIYGALLARWCLLAHHDEGDEPGCLDGRFPDSIVELAKTAGCTYNTAVAALYRLKHLVKYRDGVFEVYERARS
jgi:hypothetical protein